MVSVSTTGLHTHQRARDELTYTLWSSLPLSLSPSPPFPVKRGETLGVLHGDCLETRAHALV